MGKPYSMDLRERVIAAIEAGETRPSVARRFQISLSSVGRYVSRQRGRGSVAPDQFGGYKPYALSGYEEVLREWITQTPDMTLADIQARLARDHDVEVGDTTISNFLRKKLGLSYKKNSARRRAGARRRQGSPARLD